MSKVKKILVISRREVLNFLNGILCHKGKKYQDWHFISIYSTPKDEVLTEFNIDKFKFCGMKEYLSLLFEDVLSPGESLDGDPFILFDKKQAKLIIQMLDKIKSYPAACKLIIHCDAGISRSGAVGFFAAKYLGYNLDKFAKDNPHIHPNQLVLEILDTVEKEIHKV